jgi:hypothetical protein
MNFTLLCETASQAGKPDLRFRKNWRITMAEKIGVYVCHCGSNIAGKVDVEEVAKWAGKN